MRRESITCLVLAAAITTACAGDSDSPSSEQDSDDTGDDDDDSTGDDDDDSTGDGDDDDDDDDDDNSTGDDDDDDSAGDDDDDDSTGDDDDDSTGDDDDDDSTGDDDDDSTGDDDDDDGFIEICAWDFLPNLSPLNGSYTKLEGIPAYHKSVPTTDDNACGVSDLYIYQSAGQWHAGPVLGDTQNHWARCDSEVFVDTPSECGANWVSPENALPDAKVESGSCPSWPCAQVFVTYGDATNATDCAGTYERSLLGPNVYERTLVSGDPIYFYFNPLRARYQCGASVDQDCLATSVDESAPGWKSQREEGWVELDASTDAGPMYVQCLAAP